MQRERDCARLVVNNIIFMGEFKSTPLSQKEKEKAATTKYKHKLEDAIFNLTQLLGGDTEALLTMTKHDFLRLINPNTPLEYETGKPLPQLNKSEIIEGVTGEYELTLDKLMAKIEEYYGPDETQPEV